MNLAFAGTPEFAATVLRGLLGSDHEVGLIVSQPDSRRGRGRKTVSTPVAALAKETGVALAQPARIGEVAAEISRHDALVVAAYGQILRADTLEAARRGAWNVHASLLPAYRGAAPIERAIMAGETTTGVSIMKMDEGLDTGPVALRREVRISPETTGGELARELAFVGAEAVVQAMTALEGGALELEEQDDSRAGYAPKVSAEDRTLEWERAAQEVHDRIRALAPHIGARAFHPAVDGPVRLLGSKVAPSDPSLAPGEISRKEGKMLVGCGEGAVEILEIQLPGGKALRTDEFLRGNSLAGSFHS